MLLPFRKYVVFPVCFITCCYVAWQWIRKQNRYKKSNLSFLFVEPWRFICSFVAAADEAFWFDDLKNFNLRPRWFSFARLFVFNRLFWYVAFSASLMMCLRNRYLKRIVPFILIVQLGYIMLSRTTYNDSIYSLAAKHDSFTKKIISLWKEFYDEALFTKIRRILIIKVNR